MNEETDDRMVQQKAKEYIYQHVQFIMRGPKTGRRIIDFVPCSWVYLSKITGRLVAKYMPPPYNEENCDLLHHLVKNMSDPIANWPEYNVEIRGGARSYDEAETRLKKLHAKDFVFTSDTEATPENKVSEILRQLKQAKLKLSAETVASLKVPELHSDNEVDEIHEKNDHNGNEDPSLKETINSARRDALYNKNSRSVPLDKYCTESSLKVHDNNGNLKSKQKNRKASGNIGKSSILNTKKSTSKLQSERSIPLLDENWNLSEEGLQESVFRTIPRSNSQLFVEQVYTDSEAEGNADKNYSADLVMDSSFQLLERFDSFKALSDKNSVTNRQQTPKSQSENTCQKTSKFRDDAKSKQKNTQISSPRHYDPESKLNKAKNNPNETDSYGKFVRVKDKKTKQKKITSDSELLWAIYDDLQKIKVDVEEIKANQKHEQEARHKSEIEQGIHEDFILKHNLELPYTDKLDFDEFNFKLLSDEAFRHEFMKSLNKLFDRNVVPSKSLTNIIRKYLSCELAMQYTAVKKMPKKFLMKDEAFYDCLLGVLADTHRDKSGKYITESGFASLLGNVLGNAKDWKGNRKRRMTRNPDPDNESSDRASSGVE